MLSDCGARIVAQVGYPMRRNLQPDFLVQFSNKAFAEALVPIVQSPKESPSVWVKERLPVAQVKQDLPRRRIEQKSAGPELRSSLDELWVRSEEHSLNSSHVSISYAVFCLKKK